MTLKAVVTRASAELSRPEYPDKDLGSDNGWTVAYLNRIRNDCRGEGDPAAEKKFAAIEARFWAKVNKTDGCWLWTASVTGGNPKVQHGQFALAHGQNVYAHRFSWQLAYGPIPDGLQINHKCDVPRCVRPEHLFLGTQSDNLKDAARKERFHTPRTRTLTLADRLAIYHAPDRRGIGVELAIRYGVTKGRISTIRSGQFMGSPQHPLQSGRALSEQPLRPEDVMDRHFERVPFVFMPVVGEVC